MSISEWINYSLNIFTNYLQKIVLLNTSVDKKYKDFF